MVVVVEKKQPREKRAEALCRQVVVVGKVVREVQDAVSIYYACRVEGAGE